MALLAALQVAVCPRGFWNYERQSERLSSLARRRRMFFPAVTKWPLPLIFPEVISGRCVATVAHPLGLDVDHDGSNVVAAPTISGNVVNPALVDTTIPTGTGFNSYLLHFDPVGVAFLRLLRRHDQL